MVASRRAGVIRVFSGDGNTRSVSSVISTSNW